MFWCTIPVKMFVLVIFLSVCVVEIQNRVLVYPYSTRQQYPYDPGCYVDIIQHFLSFNESYSPQDGQTCEQYRCDYDGYTYITSCTETFEGDCIKVPGNKTLPFPDCCDHLDCRKRHKFFFPRTTPVLNSNSATQKNKTIADFERKNVTTESPQDVSESFHKISFNKTLDITNISNTSLNDSLDITNKNISSKSFTLQDESKVSTDMDNENVVNVSENTEKDISDSKILPTPTDKLTAKENRNDKDEKKPDDVIKAQNDIQSKGIEKELEENETSQ